MLSSVLSRVQHFWVEAVGPRPYGRSLILILTFAVILVGAGLRAYHFWEPGLWIDEYGTWWAVAGDDWRTVWHRVWRIHGQSPLYYYVVDLSTQVFGETRLGLRFPSLLCGIGLLTLVYPLSLRVLTRRYAALVALVIFSVNERLIWYSQDARPYSLALLCTALSFLFYLKILERPTLASRCGYVFSTAGAFYAHYLFGPIVLVQVLHLTLIYGWAWMRSRQWLVTFAGLSLIGLPGVAHVLRIFGKRESMDWVPPPEDILAPLKLVLQFFDPFVFSAVALTVLFIGWEPRNEPLPRSGRPIPLLWMWLFVPILLLAIVPALFDTVLLYQRYGLAALPPALLLMAYLASQARSKWLHQLIPVIVLVSTTFVWNLIPPLSSKGIFSDRPPSGWEQAAAHINRFARSQDIILYRSGFVEADRLATEMPDPLLLAWMNWPLTSHLSNPEKYTILGIPYRVNDRTRPYLLSLLGKVGQYARVWVVGQMDPANVAGTVARTVIRHAEFHMGEQHKLGRVLIVRLDKNIPR